MLNQLSCHIIHLLIKNTAIPPEVGALTSLRTFAVFDNKIRLLPPTTLTELTSLETLYLQKNEFQGDINFLCPTVTTDFKADCGKRGGVECDCCHSCGYSAKNDKIKMKNLSE